MSICLRHIKKERLNENEVEKRTWITTDIPKGCRVAAMLLSSFVQWSGLTERTLLDVFLSLYQDMN